MQGPAAPSWQPGRLPEDMYVVKIPFTGRHVPAGWVVLSTLPPCPRLCSQASVPVCGGRGGWGACAQWAAPRVSAGCFATGVAMRMARQPTAVEDEPPQPEQGNK